MSHGSGGVRRGRVMFVVPSDLSSGEGITVLHMCLDLQEAAHEVLVLASAFASRFLEPRLGAAVRRLTADVQENGRCWDRAVREFQPQAVVFADYPLLHFSNGVTPLLTERWLASLSSLDAELVTLDHLGYAQRERQLNFGPPHLSLHSECTPVPMERMRVLLPCPMNAPISVASRAGTPFRYQALAADSDSLERERVRHAYAPVSSHLVVHATPNWAWRIAEDWQLPHYPLFDRVLEQLLGTVERPVTVISVNNGALLAERDTPTLTIRNSGLLAHHDYEALLNAADLLITDNAVSTTIGRAALAGVPVVCFRNRRRLLDIVRGADRAARELAYVMEEARPGSVFPFDVFPIWNEADLQSLGLFNANLVTACAIHVELYGGSSSAECMRAALEDDGTRTSLRTLQAEYSALVAALPSSHVVMQTIIDADTSGVAGA